MAEKEMTKAERKAALKAAKAAAKEEAKNAANKKEGKKEDKPSDDKGNKKEKDKPSQVEKPAAEAPKDNKEQGQTPKKKKDKIPTIIPEDVSHENKPSPEEKALRRATSLVGGITGAGIPVGSTASSVDGKAMLSFVMQQRYANNEELAKRYPEVYADQPYY